MYHREDTITQRVSEPPDGARLVVDLGDGEWKVIWRDDDLADEWGAHELDRWFNALDEDPMGLYQQLKYAVAVYELGGRLVRFTDDDVVAA